MQVGDRLLPQQAAEKDVNRARDDRTGADQADGDHDVGEALRALEGQILALRPAVELEDADGIRQRQHGVDLRIVVAQAVEADFLAGSLLDQAQRLGDDVEDFETENVDLHPADIADGVLVPLDDEAILHPRRFGGDVVVNRLLGDDETAVMLTEMAGKSVQLIGEVDQVAPGAALRLLTLHRFRQSLRTSGSKTSSSARRRGIASSGMPNRLATSRSALRALNVITFAAIAA